MKGTTPINNPVPFPDLTREHLSSSALFRFRGEMFDEGELDRALVARFRLDYLPPICGDYSMPGTRLEAALKDLAMSAVEAKKDLILDFGNVTGINAESAGAILAVFVALKKLDIKLVSVNLTNEAAARMPSAFENIYNFFSIEEAEQGLGTFLRRKKSNRPNSE